MNVYRDFLLRTSRNKLLGVVTIPDPVLSYPIADLLICYQPVPQYGQQEQENNIYIFGAEADVQYSLRDEYGRELKGMIAGQLFEPDLAFRSAFLKSITDPEAQSPLKIFPEGRVDTTRLSTAEQADAFIDSVGPVVKLAAPAITSDKTYTVLAQKTTAASNKVLLSSKINFRTDFLQIDLVIKLGEKQEMSDRNTLEIDPGQPVKIGVKGSKKKMRYEIWNETGVMVASAEKENFTGDISTLPINDDMLIQIKAIQIGITGEDVESYILKQWNIIVRIDAGVEAVFKPGVQLPLAVNTTPELIISTPQLSVQYELFRFRLAKPRFSIDPPVVEPETLSEPFDLDKFNADGDVVPVYPFKKPDMNSTFVERDPALTGSNTELNEDSVLVVKATKKSTGETKWLNKHIVVRTDSPDPRRGLVVAPPGFSAGDKIMISIPNAESGVAYQLIQVQVQPDGEALTKIGPALLAGAKRIGWDWDNPESDWVFGMQIGNSVIPDWTELRNANAGFFKVREKDEDVAFNLQILKNIAITPFDPILVIFPELEVAPGAEYKVRAIKEFTGKEIDLEQSITPGENLTDD